MGCSQGGRSRAQGTRTNGRLAHFSPGGLFPSITLALVLQPIVSCACGWRSDRPVAGGQMTTVGTGSAARRGLRLTTGCGLCLGRPHREGASLPQTVALLCQGR